MSDLPFERIRTEIAQRGGRIPEEALEPLFGELWSLFASAAPIEGAPLMAAKSLGVHYLEAGVPPSQAVRDVLVLGRLLVREAVERGVDGARARLVVDEAAAQVAQAVELARRTRRQSWLSYLVHEVKNPLNTVLNALWLLREKGSDATQAARFIELAERAVKRLESRAHDVRQLDEELLEAPPGWQAMQQNNNRASDQR